MWLNGGLQPSWVLSASLSLPILLSSPAPSLSSRRPENRNVETGPGLFFPSQSCQCGKGGHDHAIGEKADTAITDTPSHALCPEPHLM